MSSKCFNKTTIFLTLLFFFYSLSLPNVNGIDSLPLPYPLFQKGMTYAAWTRDAFQKPSSDDSIKAMADCGVNCVSIIVTRYQKTFNSTEIIETDRTPSDASLQHVIKQAHKRGLYVMLKPHIDLISPDGNTRSDIGFNSDAKWEEWFSSYRDFINHYASIAAKEKVEFFCIGTELTFASSKKNFWKNVVIPDVKKIFHGQIVYAANWDEYGAVEFWDDLDYAGIDSYFPLTTKDSPSSDDIKEGWKKWMAEIEAFQQKINKPIIFTESGYCSADSAAAKPWEEAVSGKSNTDLQASCYKALFETFWNKPWFFGIYWWNWNTYAGSGGVNNKHFTPQNKPALEHVKLWYAKGRDEITVLSDEKPTQKGDAELAARLESENNWPQNTSTSLRQDHVSFSGDMAGAKKYTETPSSLKER